MDSSVAGRVQSRRCQPLFPGSTRWCRPIVLSSAIQPSPLGSHHSGARHLQARATGQPGWRVAPAAGSSIGRATRRRPPTGLRGPTTRRRGEWHAAPRIPPEGAGRRTLSPPRSAAQRQRRAWATSRCAARPRTPTGATVPRCSRARAGSLGGDLPGERRHRAAPRWRPPPPAGPASFSVALSWTLQSPCEKPIHPTDHTIATQATASTANETSHRPLTRAVSEIPRQ